MGRIECKQIAQIEAPGFNEMTGRVYDKDGCSPSVRTFCGWGQEVKVLEEREAVALDEQNGYLRSDGTVGSLTTDGSSPKHNNRIVEPMCVSSRGRNPDNPSDRTAGIHLEQRLEPNEHGTSNALTSVTKDNMVAEPIVYDDFNGRIRADQGTVGALTTNTGNDAPRNGTKLIERLEDYRIRKLTERECFRLQGVRDEDFERVREHQSKSSCYHLAGDSITVSVLMALFGEMLDIDWRGKVDRLVEDLCNVG